MDEILVYIKRSDVIFGLLIIVAGILAGVFKQYWFIAGVNTMSKKELAKIDLDYVTKFSGICFCIIGLFLVLTPFLFDHFNIKNELITPIVIISIVLFMVLYLNIFKRKRIYNKKDTGQSQLIDVPTIKWRKFICIAIFATTFVLVGLLIYLGYKEPKVIIDTNALKLKGLYGVNLSFSEITEADTIVWSEMPVISRRTNGISLNEVHRGNFRTAGDKKVHLSIHHGVSPVIRIVERDGSEYYINRKDVIETRQIFKKLNINN